MESRLSQSSKSANVCRCCVRAALENCFGFVDGTVGSIARPDENQRVVYNGHNRVHALKFQSVALPNGIIANMYGPVGGYYILINFN